jgi:hypothetical protein
MEHGGSNGVTIRDDNLGERTDWTVDRCGDPLAEVGGLLLAYDFVETIDQVAGHEQRWDIALDLSHNRRVILRYLIAFDRHKPGNLTCRRSLPYSTDRIRQLVEAAAGGPFGDDTKGSLESLYAQPPPQFGSIPAASRPERVESLGMRLKDTHAAAENLHSASSGDASDRLARKAKPSGNLFELGSPFDQLQHRVDRLLAVLEILPPLALVMSGTPT